MASPSVLPIPPSAIPSRLPHLPQVGWPVLTQSSVSRIRSPMSSNPPPMHAPRGPSTNNPRGRTNHHRPPRHRHRSPIRHGLRHPASAAAAIPTSSVASDPVYRDGATEPVPGAANTSGSLNSEGISGAPFEPDGFDLHPTAGPPEVRRRRSRADNLPGRRDTGTLR